MRGPGFREKARQIILKRRGLERSDYGRLVEEPLPPHPRHSLTPMMMVLEVYFGRSIEELLEEGTLNEVVERVQGLVDRSTISKWRKRLRDD